MAIDKKKCFRQLVKLGDNNVEHQYYLFGKNNEKVVIPEYTESYGSSRLMELDFNAQVRKVMDGATGVVKEMDDSVAVVKNSALQIKA